MNINATKEIYISDPILKKRILVLKVEPTKEKLKPNKIYKIGVKINYRSVDYSGMVLKTYFIFEEEHALFINAKYKYFIGQENFYIIDKIKLPFEVYELKPIKVLCFLYITNSYRHDDDTFICRFSYDVGE